MVIFKLLLVVLVAFAVLSAAVGPRRAWALWKRFGQAIGDALARVVMTAFYFTLFVPFAAIARRAGDPLALRPHDPPYWRPAPEGKRSLDEAAGQS